MVMICARPYVRSDICSTYTLTLIIDYLPISFHPSLLREHVSYNNREINVNCSTAEFFHLLTVVVTFDVIGLTDRAFLRQLHLGSLQRVDLPHLQRLQLSEGSLLLRLLALFFVGALLQRTSHASSILWQPSTVFYLIPQHLQLQDTVITSDTMVTSLFLP